MLPTAIIYTIRCPLTHSLILSNNSVSNIELISEAKIEDSGTQQITVLHNIQTHAKLLVQPSQQLRGFRTDLQFPRAYIHSQTEARHFPNQCHNDQRVA